MKVFIAGIEHNSPAERAGLRQADIIIGFNDRPVQHIDALHRALTDHQSGIPANVTVLRGTDKLLLTIYPILL